MHRLPSSLRDRGFDRVCDLDVRPVLASGADPFSLIMQTVKQLAPTDVLHLIVGFEPRPLYAVLQQMGRAHLTEQQDGVHHVYFYVEAGQSAPAAAPAPPARAGRSLAPPVELDVRGLEPPEPMLRILEKLAELGPCAQLLVQHHRDPVLLKDRLKERGFVARTTRRGERDFVVHILPEWALDEQR